MLKGGRDKAEWDCLDAREEEITLRQDEEILLDEGEDQYFTGSVVDQY